MGKPVATAGSTTETQGSRAGTCCLWRQLKLLLLTQTVLHDDLVLELSRSCDYAFLLSHNHYLPECPWRFTAFTTWPWPGSIRVRVGSPFLVKDSFSFGHSHLAGPPNSKKNPFEPAPKVLQVCWVV